MTFVCRNIRASRQILPLVLLSLCAARASAHHSNAIYDLDREILINGVVVDYEWVNPHVYLHIESPTQAGQTERWLVEASPPAVMVRRGWSEDTFEIGEQVTAYGSPAKLASRRLALVRSVEKADGTRLVVNSNNPDAPPDAALFDVPPPVQARDLSGTWWTLVQPGGSAMEFIFGPRSWGFTEAGAAALADYDDAASPAADCVAYTAPFSMVFPDLKSIELRDRTVIIRSSLDDVERVIDLELDSHDDAEPSNQGHSIGSWEGSALVVDTARFTARQNGNAFMLPSSSQKHIEERFELNADRTRLLYRFELRDPVYLEEPVTGEVQWAFSPDREFAAEGCDFENARRYLEGYD
jgi:hypothetical protein